MEEVKDSLFLDEQEYEQLLILARERYEKSKQLYEEAVTIKDTHPIEAVKLLYKSYELNYSSEAKEELFNSTVPLNASPEILNEEGTAEDLFSRGLQALAGIGRDRNNEIALRY